MSDEDKTEPLTRRDVGGWLSGPKASLEEQGYDFGYRGQDLGLPKDGPGSVAGLGRRFLAITLDWIACVLVARLVASGDNPDPILPLVIFFVEVALLTSLIGSSFGQRVLGIRVMDVRGGPASPGRVVLRTLLLCLVLPAVIWDRDQRGLHDKAAQSVVVRLG